ncbi:hypothetical protein R6L23_16425 [Streptomyces sp. SR27]|uniref:hypothetical protein n=1 Tax=Streptomyces sp. SR27 TaxID=3076630 RepID=UPI00295BC8E3|nr:hypothetical protein [Streptomyces sp. SR27]MDV9189782.1 hypothetical protein [Streptomyces sp. SR27]
MARTIYSTAAGYEVELDSGLCKFYMYCHGCQSGSKLKARDAERIANDHASTCRRVPSASRTASRNPGSIGPSR